MLLNLNVKIKLFLTRRGDPQKKTSEADGLTVVRLSVWEVMLGRQNHSQQCGRTLGARVPL